MEKERVEHKCTFFIAPKDCEGCHDFRIFLHVFFSSTASWTSTLHFAHPCWGVTLRFLQPHMIPSQCSGRCSMVQAGILRRYLGTSKLAFLRTKIHKLQKTGSIALLQWFLGFVKKNRNKTGWWFQPLWKIWVKMDSSSPIFGVNIKKSLSCHHLEMYEITTGNFVGLVFFGVSFSLMDLPFLNLDTKSSARQWYRHTTRQLKLTVSPATKIVGWKFLYNFLFGGSAYFQRLC